MPIPSHEDAMLPVLRALASGQALHRRVLADLMADHFRLSEAERLALLPSGKAPVIRSRTGWALSYLKQAGLVRTVKRGIYEITPRGREVVASNPPRLDSDFLEQYPEFREFRTRTRESSHEADEAPAAAVAEMGSAAPDEALDVAYARLRASVESELLDTVKSASPSFFEQLVIDLLVRMGYGGSRSEAARAVGRSGDGGIDGVIDEDRLGLDVIYVQAKSGIRQSAVPRYRSSRVRFKDSGPRRAFSSRRRASRATPRNTRSASTAGSC
jgi:restriction system protein